MNHSISILKNLLQWVRCKAFDFEISDKLLETGGNYILRTNWTEADPRKLWGTYIQLTEVEDAFRIAKHDLGMRPIYHQKTGRTQAHILVCFLSLAMWRTLQHWMKASGLGTAPKELKVLLPNKPRIIENVVQKNTLI